MIFHQLDINKNNILSHVKLLWHISQDYDFLNKLKSENLEGISKLRELILNKHQFFPFISNHIKAIESVNGLSDFQSKELINFKSRNAYFDNFPFKIKVQKLTRKIKHKLIAKKIISGK